MNYYATEYTKICEHTGREMLMEGPYIPAHTQEQAEEWCEVHMSHLTVYERVVQTAAAIHCNGKWIPDTRTIIDYKKIQCN